jgi:predicted DNA-binding antitoxin AbrB/MazE fold protein
MREQIEVVYENGVLRPLGPLPAFITDKQRFTVIINGTNGPENWLADADPRVSLEAVRQSLARVQGTLALAVHAEREER